MRFLPDRDLNRLRVENEGLPQPFPLFYFHYDNDAIKKAILYTNAGRYAHIFRGASDQDSHGNAVANLECSAACSRCIPP